MRPLQPLIPVVWLLAGCGLVLDFTPTDEDGSGGTASTGQTAGSGNQGQSQGQGGAGAGSHNAGGFGVGGLGDIDVGGSSAGSGPSVCGDGFQDLEQGEECDDNNVDSGDGCSPACSLECPDGYDARPSTATCLGFGNVAAAWPDARTACVQEQGDLALMKAPDRGVSDPRFESRWIGASRVAAGSPWTWVDGTPADVSIENAEPDGNCVLAVFSDVSPDVRLFMAPCEDPHLFLCERDPTQ